MVTVKKPLSSSSSKAVISFSTTVSLKSAALAPGRAQHSAPTLKDRVPIHRPHNHAAPSPCLESQEPPPQKVQRNFSPRWQP